MNERIRQSVGGVYRRNREATHESHLLYLALQPTVISPNGERGYSCQTAARHTASVVGGGRGVGVLVGWLQARYE